MLVSQPRNPRSRLASGLGRLLDTRLGMRVGVRLLRFWIAGCNLCLSLLGRLLYADAPSANPLRVLVIRGGYIGDLLMSIPALDYLRRAGASESRIALLTHPTPNSVQAVSSPAAELLRDWKFIDTVIYSPTRLGWPIREVIRDFAAQRVVFMPYTFAPFKSFVFQTFRLRLIGVTVRPEGLVMGSVSCCFRKLQSDAGLASHQALTATCKGFGNCREAAAQTTNTTSGSCPRRCPHRARRRR